MAEEPTKDELLAAAKALADLVGQQVTNQQRIIALTPRDGGEKESRDGR